MDIQNKEITSRNLLSLAIYSLSHFVVDFSCAFLLFRLLKSGLIVDEQKLTFFLTYNSLAFGLEFVIGLFFNLRTSRICSCIGIFVLLSGVILGSYLVETPVGIPLDFLGTNSAMWAFILAGVGNAFFHVGGGIDTLGRDLTKCWRSGVFISTGALGIAFGALYAERSSSSFFLVGLCLFICLWTIWFVTRDVAIHRRSRFLQKNVLDDLENQKVSKKRTMSEFDKRRCFTFVVASLFVIWVRSSIGLAASDFFFVRSSIEVAGLSLAFASFLGKFIGGFLSDTRNSRMFNCLALLGTIPTLCFSNSIICVVLGIFLLNISTATTLLTVTHVYSRRLGFAFGLTTLALLSGFWLNRSFSFVLELESGIVWITISFVIAIALATLFLRVITSQKNFDLSAKEENVNN